ncbi:PRDX2_4 [Lepeophtheirus salmonis]|uniref:PRDX2_4 n=1 Tax=Lepeophtheirus salmonis TaxID=72036 RepID=A0A7R8CQH8_LEPSM|nr:PRDX2_4 [Lepeophtheirus salmonis]CAF2895503.1 PRDX2_4 [Lepeophtheirus salmonis]
MVENENDPSRKDSKKECPTKKKQPEGSYKDKHNQEIISLENQNKAAKTFATDCGEGNINIRKESATTEEDESNEQYKNGGLKLLTPVTKTGVEKKRLFIIDVIQNLCQITMNDLPVRRCLDEPLSTIYKPYNILTNSRVYSARWRAGKKCMKPSKKVVHLNSRMLTKKK